VNRRHHTDKAVASSSRSSKKLMSKLLKYHVIGSAVDGQQSSAPGGGTPGSMSEAPPRPTQSEPDIFQLPPLPAGQQSSEAALSR